MNWPNRITILRVMLIPVFVALIQYYQKYWGESGEIYRYMAISVFLIATFSDALDGFLARILNQQTRLGIILDPLADKLLLISATILLSRNNTSFSYVLPIWYTCLVIGRDVIIVIGSWIVHMVRGDVHIVPSIVGKFTTAFQMMTVLWILFKLPYPYLGVYVTSFLTIISGTQYILFGSHQLQDENSKGKA